MSNNVKQDLGLTGKLACAAVHRASSARGAKNPGKPAPMITQKPWLTFTWLNTSWAAEQRAGWDSTALATSLSWTCPGPFTLRLTCAGDAVAPRQISACLHVMPVREGKVAVGAHCKLQRRVPSLRKGNMAEPSVKVWPSRCSPPTGRSQESL